MSKPEVICIFWKQCEYIAKYYEFPAAIFLLDKKTMRKKLKGTRMGSIRKKLGKAVVKLVEANKALNEYFG